MNPVSNKILDLRNNAIALRSKAQALDLEAQRLAYEELLKLHNLNDQEVITYEDHLLRIHSATFVAPTGVSAMLVGRIINKASITTDIQRYIRNPELIKKGDRYQ